MLDFKCQKIKFNLHVHLHMKDGTQQMFKLILNLMKNFEKQEMSQVNDLCPPPPLLKYEHEFYLKWIGPQ